MNVNKRIKKAATRRVIVTVVGAVVVGITGVAVPEPILTALIDSVMMMLG